MGLTRGWGTGYTDGDGDIRVFRRGPLTFSRSPGKRVEGLAEQFRSSVNRLVGSVPLTAASVSVRPREGGPLDLLYTCGFEGAVAEPGLALGDEARRWLEANRRELVLAVRPEHRGSGFYRPFIEHGIRTAIIVPIFRSGRLAGTVTVGSGERDAYTARHLQLIRMMTAELTPFFAKPVPPSRTYLEPEVTPGSWGPGRPHAAVDVEEREPSRPPAAEVVPPEPGEAPREARIEADALGRIAEWNEAAERIFGWSRCEVVGHVLTLFYREKNRRLIDPTLIGRLLRDGTFRGRALTWDSSGLPVCCEVELKELETAPGRARGFRGRFRRVPSHTLLAHESLEFGFARLYDFSNPLR